MSDEKASGAVSRLWKWLGLLIRFTVTIGVVGVSVGVAYYWLANRPVTERRPPQPRAALVEVVTVHPGPEQIFAPAMGTVVPARSISLPSRVSGQIVATSPHFVPGGRFAAGEIMLEIDRRDYELLIEQQEGNLVRAESDVRIEMGQQAVARREYDILGESMDVDDDGLLLRRPQLAAREAAVAIARATLDKARLDLERATIRAPFNAVVQARSVEVGAYVAPGASLASLAGTDEFWVETLIAIDELRWISLPTEPGTEGARARVYHQAAWGDGVFREGRVVRLLPELESQGRMARLLIAVKQPLADVDGLPPLLLGSFVRVEIEGDTLPEAIRLPRTLLHDGNTVWIMSPEDTLDTRQVDIAWGAGEDVLIVDGLVPGDRIVTSDLAGATPGMLLRTADDTRSKDDGGERGRP